MVSQWIPNAIDKGYLKDITHTLGEHMLCRKRSPDDRRGERSPSLFHARSVSGGYLSNGGTVFGCRLQRHTGYSRRRVGGCGSSKQPIQSSLDHAFGVRSSSFRYRCTDSTRDQDGGGVVKEHYLKWYFEHIRIYLSPMEGVLISCPKSWKRR